MILFSFYIVYNSIYLFEKCEQLHFAFIIITIKLLIFISVFITIALLRNKYKFSSKEKTITPQKRITTNNYQKIEENLIQLEKQKFFKNSSTTLHSLAILLKTNRTELSEYINKRKGKNFTQYINNLRINYIKNKLINNTKLRKYTLDGLAVEAGFNNRKTFSDAFLLNTGVRPSIFIKTIQEKKLQ